jgi:hypothetical protein
LLSFHYPPTKKEKRKLILEPATLLILCILHAFAAFLIHATFLNIPFFLAIATNPNAIFILNPEPCEPLLIFYPLPFRLNHFNILISRVTTTRDNSDIHGGAPIVKGANSQINRSAASFCGTGFSGVMSGERSDLPLTIGVP